MSIRPETSSDEGAIRCINRAAFRTAGEAQLVDALRDAGKLCVSLVAELDGEIVGHIAFSPVTLEGATPDRNGVGLGPVAVAPGFQCRGIGGQLIREGLAACRQVGVGFVVVLGNPSYYGRFGFAPASRWGLRGEYGGGDAFMVIELQTNAVPAGAGLVRYAPEFAVVAK